MSAKNILNLTHTEARAFFLRSSSYCTFDLPSYFSFDSILKEAESIIKQKIELKYCCILKDSNKTNKDSNILYPSNFHEVNYTIFANKDANLSWRPLQLIHPVLYVALVDLITGKDNWDKIVARFKYFRKTKHIRCKSMPVCSNIRNDVQQISNWRKDVVNETLRKSIDFNYIYETDIANCYSSIYTHSITWSLHGKEESKRLLQKDKLKGELGHSIDVMIQGMSYGQTNGIPQGSILMDFIAEIVLGYIDIKLEKAIKESKITNYYIIRFRDDYRIFVNTQEDGQQILKCLSDVAHDMGLRLNSSKTDSADSIVLKSVKKDKIALINDFRDYKSYVKRSTSPSKQQTYYIDYLLKIYTFSLANPNSSQISAPLTELFESIIEPDKIHNKREMISIIADLAYHNPSVQLFRAYIGIVSKLIEPYTTTTKKRLMDKFCKKISSLANTDYLDIWMQRLMHPIGMQWNFPTKLCQIISGSRKVLWNSDWMQPDLKQRLENCSIYDVAALNAIPAVLSIKEINIFSNPYVAPIDNQ